MRVAFTGASGTGKTTLAEYAAKKHGLEFNPVGSRSVAKEMGFDSPYDVDKVGKRAEFQRRLIASKREWEASHESFVTDRTTFDNLAYLALHDVQAIDADLVAAAIDGLRRYTHIIYCPLNAFFAVGDDPMRVKAQDYHTIFDILLEGLFIRHAWGARVSPLVLETGSIADRKFGIDAYLALKDTLVGAQA